MLTVRVEQKIVALDNREQVVPLAGADADAVRVELAPADLAFGMPVRGARGWEAPVRAGTRRLAHAPVRLALTAGGVTHTVDIPSRIFGDREGFLCMATTSNFHWGHHPGRVAEMEALGKGWPDLMRDPLIDHGHAYPSARYFAEGVHACGLPMTWILDGMVAEAGAAEIARWHQTHGDDVGLLPPSFFFKNPINYNTERTPEETLAVLDATRERVQRAFAGAGWLMAPAFAGVDQWVGSLGTHWLQSAAAIGLRGVWGICHDHVTCDGSVHHEGAPWEPYRMRPDNFRYPSTDANHLWAFPWTARDLCNSFLHYPGASVWFSTDPDDITGISITPNQHDYWDRMLRDHVASLAHSDFFCFVMHNEDHDAHRERSRNYIMGFLKRLPREVVPATLHEVLLWLELRYPDGTHPTQLVEARDPLTCHDAIDAFLRGSPYTRDAWKPEAYWKTCGGHNPTVICAYDAASRWYAVEGERLPRQFIDYTAPSAFRETGESPKAALPTLTDWTETEDGPNLRVTFHADRAFPRLPLIWWDRPELRGDRATSRTRIVVADVRAGANIIHVRKEQGV